jgi:hypothetical protein
MGSGSASIEPDWCFKIMMESFNLNKALVVYLIATSGTLCFSQAQSSVPVKVGILDMSIDTEDSRVKDQIFHNQQISVDDEFNGDYLGWNAVTSRPLSGFDKNQISKNIVNDYLKYNELEKMADERELSIDEKNLRKSFEKSMPLRAYVEFTTHAHGQHVAGLVLNNTKNVKIIPITFIEPGEKDHDSFQLFMDQNDEDLSDENFLKGLPQKYYALIEVRRPLYRFVNSEIQNYLKGFRYISARKMQLVNMSIGSNLKDKLASFLKSVWRFHFISPPSAVVESLYGQELQKYISEALFKALAKNSEKLFILASGNHLDSGENNLDSFPRFPSAVQNWFKPDNLIVVGATRGRSSLANFSGYGVRTVDVAAPGVNIKSFAPGGLSIFMSGTSQATPYVTNAAARILEINPKLNPDEVKKILIATVDFKDFLTGVVSSGGIVNPKRAIRAAKLSLNFSIDQAVRQSRIEEPDLESDNLY